MAVRVVVDLIGWRDYVVVLRYDRMNYSMLDLAQRFAYLWSGANGQLGSSGSGTEW